MNFNTIASWLDSQGQPNFRLKQLHLCLQKGVGDWSNIKGWPQALSELVLLQIPFVSYVDSTVFTSVDGTHKATLTLSDGEVIETVLMQPKPGLYSVCVSCEVGCPMNCAFCATGKIGFKRVLTSEEITDQWLFWLQYQKQNRSPLPTHIVFMGMGEPFHNQTNVFAALNDLHDVYGLGWRKMSVSTSGIIPGIESFAGNFNQVNLAISLHSALPQIRSKLMPVNKAYSLEALKTSLVSYLNKTKRQVMFEYLLLDSENDQPQDFVALVEFLKAFPTHLIHVNLIRYNPTGNFTTPSPEIVTQWKKDLVNMHISVSIRKNLGTDIMGACGQLAGNTKSSPKHPLAH